MINYELLALVAVFAFVYSNILTEPDMVLSGWYKFWYKVFKTDNRLLQGKGYHWAFKIIVHCEKCIAGQLALWLSLISNWFDIIINHDYSLIVSIVLSITFTIFVTMVVKNTYNRYIKYE